MNSVHNPSQFNPADYAVIDYADNKRPVFLANHENPEDAMETWKRDVAFWEADMQRLLGAEWRQKIHRCVHCGNGHVRWITAVEHQPTGERVVFGADCTQRLGFVSRNAFKLAQLKRKADCFAAALKVAGQVEAFLQAHPEVQAIYGVIRNPDHVQNTFVRDVLSKLARFGSISDKQIAAIVSSIQRDIARANRPVEAKVEAPIGKGVTIAGEVMKTEWKENDYGSRKVMTVKVVTANGIWLAWGTVPRDI